MHHHIRIFLECKSHHKPRNTTTKFKFSENTDIWLKVYVTMAVDISGVGYFVSDMRLHLTDILGLYFTKGGLVYFTTYGKFHRKFGYGRIIDISR